MLYYVKRTQNAVCRTVSLAYDSLSLFPFRLAYLSQRIHMLFSRYHGFHALKLGCSIDVAARGNALRVVFRAYRSSEMWFYEQFQL